MTTHRVTVTYSVEDEFRFDNGTPEQALEAVKKMLPKGAKVEAIMCMSFGPPEDSRTESRRS
jgi:hypothetical protein